MIRDLQSFIEVLRQEKELVEISAEVDPYLEAAEIHRRVIEKRGPALLFTNIKGAEFPLVTNLFGNDKRLDLAFGRRPEEFVARLAKLPEVLMPPSLRAFWRERRTLGRVAKLGTRRTSPGAAGLIVDDSPRLNRLPLLTTWKEDGGPFVTLPLVYTELPGTHISNLGMYRLQRFDDETTGFHVQIGKGAGYHLAEAKRRGEKLPVHVFVGGPPALIISAIAPLPENVPEMMLASLVLGEKVPVTKLSTSALPIVSSAEFTLMGEVDPNVLRPEGPFGDHYGYYSLQHDYPVFRVKKVVRRKNAVWAATVVGKGRQEDCYIGDYLQRLLSPIFPIVMPAVVDLWAYPEKGYHSLAGAIVKPQRYKREALTSAFRILGEGQLALTKFLIVVERHLDLRDFRALLEHALERADFGTDLYVLSNTSMDTLDYTTRKINEGSKGVLLGVGEPVRSLPHEFKGPLPFPLDKAVPFCRGCLVVSGQSYEKAVELPRRIAEHQTFTEWPLIVLVDDASQATRSQSDFLWHTFTRFEPASDIVAAQSRIERNRVAYTAPIVIDARMKPWYPAALECDPATEKLVTQRWREYFPK